MLLKSNISDIKSIFKHDNILFSEEECYCYASDASDYSDEKSIPDLVVFPNSIEEIQSLLKYANMHDIPVVARGAGTNMVGGCLCIDGGIVLNFSKMNKILEVNPVNMTFRVQAGAVLGDIKKEVEKFGLYFPPDPSNYMVSTIGGAISQSSGGAFSFKYGTTKDYVLSLKVVTANGELLTLGAETSKFAAGYHLTQLMVGSEGTLGIVVEAVLKLIPKPETSNVIVAYFNSCDEAVSAVNKLLVNGIHPAAIEYMDNNSIITIEEFLPSRFKTVYDCVILIELDGDKQSVVSQSEKTVSILKEMNSSKIYLPPTRDDYERVWRARRASYAAAARLAPDVISDDIIVPRFKIAEVIKECRKICMANNLKMCLVGHLGDGNFHPQIVLDTNNEEEFRNYNKARAEIYSAVISMGGSISAEHGIGLQKMDYLSKIADKNAIEYMRKIKNIFDPNNILNRGKVLGE